jgi:hypothetical protein
VVLAEITWFSNPAFSSSIYTNVPGFPVEVQVIVWAVPWIQLCPLLGDVTVKAPMVIEKFVLLESVIEAIVVPVTLFL